MEGTAYLQELRERIPILRKKEKLIESEIQSIKNAELDRDKYLSLLDTMEGFLAKLRESSDILKLEIDKAYGFVDFHYLMMYLLQ